MEQKINELKSNYSINSLKKRFYNEASQHVYAKSHTYSLQSLKYFNYCNIVLLLYLMKYVIKYFKYSEFINDYHSKTSYFNKATDFLKFFAPQLSKLFDIGKEFTLFLGKMAINSLAIVNNSMSTMQILKDGFLLRDGFFSDFNFSTLYRIFQNTFIIQLKNPYNLAIFIAIFVLHILVLLLSSGFSTRSAFLKTCFNFFILDALGFICRVFFISLGGIEGLYIKYDPLYIIIGLCFGCFIGCVITIFLNKLVVGKLHFIQNSEISKEYYRRAMYCLGVNDKNTYKEIQMETLKQLQINNEKNLNNQRQLEYNAGLILTCYEIVQEKLKEL